MADRRMFSKNVINSARFLRMPQSSRLLYYDLGMSADDDGVAEAFTVMRTTGASEEDLNVLGSKGFVTVLNDDLVTFINDWKKNNCIRQDRYTPGLYSKLLPKVSQELRQTSDNQMTTICQPTDNQMSEKYNKDNKVNEVNEDKVINEAGKPPKHTHEKEISFVAPSVEEIKTYCAERHSNVDPVRFWEYFNAGGWKDSEGKPVRNWKQKIITWENHKDEKGGNRNADCTGNIKDGASERKINYSVDGTKL